MIHWKVTAVIAIVGILAFLAGFLVQWALDWMTNKYERPTDVLEEGWNKLVSNVDSLTKGGKIAGWLIGTFERIYYVAAIWQGAIALIPAWMAVKVATKWQVWSGLLDVLKIKSEDVTRRHEATRYIRWRVSQRFLLGNLLNAILAGVIYFVAQRVFECL